MKNRSLNVSKQQHEWILTEMVLGCDRNCRLGVSDHPVGSTVTSLLTVAALDRAVLILFLPTNWYSLVSQKLLVEWIETLGQSSGLIRDSGRLRSGPELGLIFE